MSVRWSPRAFRQTAFFARKWRFGMKCPVGVNAGSGLAHTIKVTPENVHDVTVTAELIREGDEVVYGDSGYPGIRKRPEAANGVRPKYSKR